MFSFIFVTFLTFFKRLTCIDNPEALCKPQKRIGRLQWSYILLSVVLWSYTEELKLLWVGLKFFLSRLQVYSKYTAPTEVKQIMVNVFYSTLLNVFFDVFTFLAFLFLLQLSHFMFWAKKRRIGYGNFCIHP